MERFKCECGNDEFIPNPIIVEDYQSATVECTKCNKVYGLPKVKMSCWKDEGDSHE